MLQYGWKRWIESKSSTRTHGTSSSRWWRNFRCTKTSCVYWRVSANRPNHERIRCWYIRSGFKVLLFIRRSLSEGLATFGIHLETHVSTQKQSWTVKFQAQTSTKFWKRCNFTIYLCQYSRYYPFKLILSILLHNFCSPFSCELKFSTTHFLNKHLEHLIYFKTFILLKRNK